MRFPYLVAALALPLLLCLIPFRNKEHSSRWLSAAVAVFSAAVAIPALYILPCRDSLLHRQLKAERCIEAGDWDGVLKQTALSDVTNDILVAYRNIALFRKGQLFCVMRAAAFGGAVESRLDPTDSDKEPRVYSSISALNTGRLF